MINLNLKGKIKMIKVANIRTFTPDGSLAIRVDRKSNLGNPFTMNGEANRDLVCDKYEQYFTKRSHAIERSGFTAELAQLRKMAETKDITLLCWCAPKRCHADTIKRYLDNYLLKGEL